MEKLLQQNLLSVNIGVVIGKELCFSFTGGNECYNRQYI